MNERTFIIWIDDYSTGNKIIDDQHKVIIEIINDFLNMNDNVTDKSAIDKILEKLENYANEHFSYEEKYMKTVGYKKLKYHKKKHIEYIENIARFKKLNIIDELEAYYELSCFLKNWWINHILNIDQDYKTS